MSKIYPEFSSAEAQRLYYLGLLGVDTYYPRVVLPGALPSVACEWPLAELSAVKQKSGAELSLVTTPSALESDDAHRKKVESLSQLLSQEESKPVVTKELEEDSSTLRTNANVVPAPKAPVQAESDSAAEDTDMQFRVILLQIDNKLVVCNQIPALSREGFGQQERQLLENILLWLGCSLQTEKAARFFNWPLPGMGSASRLVAGKSFNSFLQQAQQELGFTRLLLMGSSSLECLEEFESDSKVQALPWEQTATHSLAEMLALPILKKEVWQHLLPLHAQLNKR